jgi:hypothetical protein
MAILQGLDGKYYEVPNDQLAKFLIPDDKVKEKLVACGEDLGPPPPPSSMPTTGSPSVVVQIYGSGGPMAGPAAGPGSPPPEEAVGAAGEVMAYSAHWHNHHWHNHHWHNHHWHNHQWQNCW